MINCSIITYSSNVMHLAIPQTHFCIYKSEQRSITLFGADFSTLRRIHLCGTHQFLYLIPDRHFTRTLKFIHFQPI